MRQAAMLVVLAACGPRANLPGDRGSGAAPAVLKNRADAGAAPAAAPNAFVFDPALFTTKRPAAPGEWLAEHDERALSFEAYVRGGPPRAILARQVIVLQPLGPFAPRDAELLETLRAYLGAFFGLPTRIATPLPLPALGMRQRHEGRDAWVQYRTDVVIDQVLAPRLPADAVCMLGITMADLYPDPSWNYVFGMASIDRRVGVYSLARYGPGFSHQRDDAAARTRTLRRALLVVAHETGHMFGLPHCVRYECLMNGTNSLAELDRGTLWLCPDCLRKLQWNLGFDVRDRTQALRAFFGARGVADAVAWLDRRLAGLEAAPRHDSHPR